METNLQVNEQQRDKIRQILKEELNLLEVPPTARREDFQEWDSLTFMSVVSRVEEEFGIEAGPENIQAFGSVDGILGEIRRAGK